MTPRAAHAHPHLAELLALLRREDFVDFGIGVIELATNPRLNAVHDRVDPRVMLVDDALHAGLLLR